MSKFFSMYKYYNLRSQRNYYLRDRVSRLMIKIIRGHHLSIHVFFYVNVIYERSKHE